MARTRRSVLSGTAALVTTLAGCGDRAGDSSEGTVTPVEVPRTDEELLAEAASVPGPSIPSATVVTDDHLSAAIGHGESMLAAVEDGLETLRGTSADDHPGPFRGDAGSLVEQASGELDGARDRGPSEAGLDSARRAVRTIAPPYGYVRATVEGVDPSDLERELEAVGERRSRLREQFPSAPREPLAEYLPTLYAAEVALGSGAQIDGLIERLDELDPDDDRYPRLAADVQGLIERHRRDGEDAALFVETATDPGGPSVEAALEATFREVRSDLERIAGAYRLDVEDRPDRSTLRGTIRDLRYSAGARTGEVRRRTAEAYESGLRIRPLLDAIEGLVAFESADEAVAVTLERLERGEFPTERVVSEKRRAVANLEAIAGASALQRHLADRGRSARHLDGSAHSRLLAGDRLVGRGESDVESIALAHANYVQAATWADLAVERGARLSSSLQG